MVQELYRRWRADDWPVEVALGVIIAVVSATGAWVGDAAAEGRFGAVPAALALLAGLVLVLRRVLPLTVLGVVLAVLVTASVAGHQIGMMPVTLLMAGHAVGRWASAGRAYAGLVAVWVTFALLALTGDAYFSTPLAVLAPLIYAVPFAVGRFAAHRTQRQRQETEDARDAERSLLARELHDIVTHALTAITVQAGTARHLGTRDAAATETFARIESQGRTALNDLRRMLDLLREEQPASLRPAPSLRDLPALAESHRLAHGPVELTLQGSWVLVGDSIGLTAYRVVQEALTNVARHAQGAPAAVVVSCDEHLLAVTVEDGGPGGLPEATRTHGLVGMRERVSMVGGTLDVGPGAEGGFRVRALIPVGP